MKSNRIITYAGENDFVPRMYRSRDQIKNFRIKVRFQKPQSINIPVPEFAPGEGDKQQPGADNNEPEYEERVFCWQEKVFSESEVEFYRHSGNCHTALQEKYHQQVLTLPEQNGCLFTYIDVDGFTEEIDVVTGRYSCSPAGGRLRLKNNQSFARRRPKTSGGSIVDSAPSDEMKRRNHILNVSEQQMYIMADLRRINSLSRNDGPAAMLPAEVVLCRLTWDRHLGQLTVHPDFSPPSLEGVSEPYLLELGGDSRTACRYWLFHASHQPDDSIIPIKASALSLRAVQLGLDSDFETPQPGTLKTSVLGEIISGCDFDYDYLFVEYCFDLHEGWSSPTPENLSGTTHRSITNGAGVAHFGHGFNVDFLCADDFETERRRPQLLMRVVSLDGWGRCRVEGYCHVALPPHPGRHVLQVPTWRVIPHGHFAEMRRFFVGGGCVAPMDIAGVPSGLKEKPVLGKIGLRTASSGSLTLRLDVVRQTADRTDDWDHNVPRHLSSAALLQSVEAVVAAFTRARHRMLRARQGLSLAAGDAKA